MLNARIGPGTNYYPVIDAFEADERGLQQVTCVPLLTGATYEKLTQAQFDAIPERWCLMRSADLSRAGWVPQRYLVGDAYETAQTSAPAGSDAMIADAVLLVRALYKNAGSAANVDSHPLDPANALNYFSADVVQSMQAQPPQADPVFGVQNFSGSYGEPVPDPGQAMFRGMISLNVEIVNFGHHHTAIFRLRADPDQPDAPIRIFRIEHDNWSFP
ncbi:hypothetical protein [Parahaliea mediterranea]|uniref:Uncharacterized protein n=1 Tax=Parahaliea mediterranea TaxID=651086 RepID=A0A939IKU7_9GAMM|nr:hypothetical protein [Parahaliea mediterranea]MBN7795303.1 hypothetical protein [Parahaliea mediterranea]